MSELRPDTPARRPDTARPREEVPQVDPPTTAELEAIQRQLVRRGEQEGAEVVVDEQLGVTFVRGPGSEAELTYAAMPRWDGGDWEERLESATARLREMGAWPSLLVCDRLDRPRGLGDAIRAKGWTRVSGESVLWVGHASVVPHLDPRLRIEAVQPKSVPLHERLEREIFGIGAGTAARRRDGALAALGSGTMRAWIVWLDEEPIAVARLSEGEGVAGIGGVGVVPSHRGEGYATLITTIATRAGMAVGNRIIWLSVDEDSATATKVYANLGFERAFGWTRWLATEDPRSARP